MAEYIERTRLLEILTDYYNCAAVDDNKPLSVCTAADCLSIVEGRPTADVVEVVRCDNCKHLRVLNDNYIYAVCDKAKTLFEPFEIDTRTHFCGFGERKEGVDK